MIFATCFMLRGRDTHIDFLRLLFLVDMIDDLPSDARAFSSTSFETQSSSLRLRVVGSLIFSKVPP